MTPFNYHAHTVLGDGKHTPEQMVLAALEAGCDSFGFSEHLDTVFGCDYAMKAADEPLYRAAVAALQAEYGDRIALFCGIEADVMSPAPVGYDYIIGSAHYFALGQEYIDIDDTPKKQRYAADRYFGGDMIALTCHYFETLCGMPQRFIPNIIGHFDLIAKFNEGGALFDECDPRYRRAGERAIEMLAGTGAAFEINTGAIARGYRKEPYPSLYFLNIMREVGAPITFSGDAHSAETVVFGFERALTLAKQAGFRSLRKLGRRGWYDEEI